MFLFKSIIEMQIGWLVFGTVPRDCLQKLQQPTARNGKSNLQQTQTHFSIGI